MSARRLCLEVTPAQLRTINEALARHETDLDAEDRRREYLMAHKVRGIVHTLMHDKGVSYD